MVNDEFTMEELVELIINFYNQPIGYSREERDCTELEKFISRNYCSYNSETQKYVINEEGRNFLHKYIENFTNEFVKLIKKERLIIIDDAVEWFQKKYQLQDEELAEEICNYICFNAKIYGYKISKACSKGENVLIFEM